MARVLLSRDRANFKGCIVNREQYLKTYDLIGKNMKLLEGAPLIVNVEGTYVKVDSLMDICLPEYKHIMNGYMVGLKRPWETLTAIDMRWKR